MLKAVDIGFQAVSALAALAAAGLWWWSTRITPPDNVTWLGMRGGFGPSLGGPLGGGEAFPVVSKGFDEMVRALNEQSRRNRLASYAAAVAAAAQGLALALDPFT